MLHLGLIAGERSDDRGPREVIDWPTKFDILGSQARHPGLAAFYGAGVVSPDTPLTEVPMVAIDLETTGLDPECDEIVSIAALPLDLQRIRASETRQWIVKPRAELNEQSITLHGITHAQVTDAPDLLALVDDLLRVFARHVVVVHCREVERAFLRCAFRQRIGEPIEFPMIDTMAIEAGITRRRKPGLLARLRGQRPPSLRLADCRARYGLPRYRPHQATNDALACAELLQAKVAQHIAAATPVGALWW